MCRLIDTALGSASWNMALDEALLYSFKEGDLPILRLYAWEPALSFGRFLRIDNSVDLDELKKQKLSCVRRMTGGGVLVHGDDLSYSLVLPRLFGNNKSVKETYRYLCGFLIRFYEKLGFKAQFASDLYIDNRKSDICLAGREAYDIVIKGKKMGGNAQRHIRHALLQHGSIPISFDEKHFKPVFLEDSGLQSAATLQKLGTMVPYEDLVKLLIETFSETFNVNIVPDTLSLEEESKAKELLMSKYNKQRWNLYADKDIA